MARERDRERTRECVQDSGTQPKALKRVRERDASERMRGHGGQNDESMHAVPDKKKHEILCAFLSLLKHGGCQVRNWRLRSQA